MCRPLRAAQKRQLQVLAFLLLVRQFEYGCCGNYDGYYAYAPASQRPGGRILIANNELQEVPREKVCGRSGRLRVFAFG